MAGDQQAQGIVQQWTLDTTQAQAAAQQLGAAVENSARRGSAAADQLDSSLRRSGRSVDVASRYARSFESRLRTATVAVSLLSHAQRIAAADSDDLASSIGGAAREAGLMSALLLPARFTPWAFALTVAGGALEVLTRKQKQATSAVKEYVDLVHGLDRKNEALEVSLDLLKQLGRDPTQGEIDFEWAKRRLASIDKWGLATQRAPGEREDLAQGMFPKEMQERIDLADLALKRISSTMEENAALQQQANVLDRILGGENERDAVLNAQAEAWVRQLDAAEEMARQSGVLHDIGKAEVDVLREKLKLVRAVAGRERDAEEMRARMLKADQAANAVSASFTSSLANATVDGLFEGFHNADEILINFGKQITGIVSQAFFDALLGEATKNAWLGIFKGIFGVKAAQFGGTFTEPSITRIAEREPEVVLRTRDLRALEREGGTGSGAMTIRSLVSIDSEQHVTRGVSSSLLRSMRPTIRRPRNVAEARAERIR